MAPGRSQAWEDRLTAQVDKILASRQDRAGTLFALVTELRLRGFKRVSFKKVREVVDVYTERYVRIGQSVMLATPPEGCQNPGRPVHAPQPPLPPQASVATLHDPSGFAGYYCPLCDKTCATQRAWVLHCSTNAHRVKQMARVIADSGHSGRISSGPPAASGVSVSELEEVEHCELGATATQTLSVRNIGRQNISLLSFNLLRNSANVEVTNASGVLMPGMPQSLAPGASTQLSVVVKPQAYGILQDAVLLGFGSFVIMRRISVRCSVQLPPGVDLRPSAPYQPKPRQHLQKPVAEIIPGEAPEKARFKYKNPPGVHKPPAWMEDAFMEGRVADVEQQLAGPVSTVQQYCNKLKNLMWVEELQHEVDVRQYDMEGAELHPDRSRAFMYLDVPGLAENRPSVMKGDALFLSRAGERGREWEGFVHHVERERVGLKFKADFHRDWIQGTRFNVRFSISRATFNFMQSAISRCPDFLHPATVLGQPGLQGAVTAPASYGGSQGPLCITTQPHWTCSLNEQQQLAVRSILAGAHAPLPYLVFGPPGTGKTMTITEAVLQVYKLDPSSRLLLVAPSNSAADLLAQKARERGVPASALMRVCAFSRPLDDLPQALHNVSNISADNCFSVSEADVSSLKTKRLVAVTCIMAAKLYAHGLPRGHFTHIFIDEAGHAEEPLMLAAISGLLSHSVSARLVMAGDPQQLGPIILSPLAQRLGLATSAMERLIQAQPYARSEQPPHYNSRYVCKLLVNYRSHPAILRLPNALFYSGELQVGADPFVTHGLLGFKGIDRAPRKNTSFPIVFHSIVGKDEREANSPSWFNGDEAALVGKYVSALLDMRSNCPSPLDIGVISPYRKQVQKIRTVLTAAGIKVGSVEEFQGQERRAIIVSTVRSNTQHLEMDNKHRLGFLKNPKRFNVAITRAKALLIVVGNPEVLMHDPCWSAFLQYVYRNDSWLGAPPPSSLVAACTLHGPAGSAVEDSWVSGLGALSSAAGYGLGSVTQAPRPAAVAGAVGAGSRQEEEQDLEQVLLDTLMSRLRLQEGGAGPMELEDRSALHVEGGEMPRYD